MNLVLLGLLAGIDNLQVAAALSVAGLTPRRRALFAVMFALSESLAPVLGVLLAHQLGKRLGVSFDGIGPYVVVACGAAIILLACFGDDGDAAKLANSRWTIFGLPLTLSVDNIFIGISAATLDYPPVLAAAAVGIISALLCVAGIAFGARLRRLIPANPELVSGCALIVIAASMWIRN